MSRDPASLTLQETGSTVEIEVQVLDLAEICELLVNIIFLSFFVDAGHYQNPAFHGSVIMIELSSAPLIGDVSMIKLLRCELIFLSLSLKVLPLGTGTS